MSYRIEHIFTLEQAIEQVKDACNAGDILFMTYAPEYHGWEVFTLDRLRELIAVDKKDIYGR